MVISYSTPTLIGRNSTKSQFFKNLVYCLFSCKSTYLDVSNQRPYIRLMHILQKEISCFKKSLPYFVRFPVISLFYRKSFIVGPINQYLIVNIKLRTLFQHWYSTWKHVLVFLLFIISRTLVAFTANHKILRSSAKIDLFFEPSDFHKNCSILTKLKSSSN